VGRTVIRVVLADDQALVRAGFRMLLDAEDDIEVVGEADDGAAALALATQRRVDLVLTDQNMPNMDGLSLVASLRALPEYRKVPIMMLTTESSPEMKAKGRAAGATGWMVKPFDPEKLVSMLRAVLSTPAPRGA
jgi:two-component system chemotaxis response regulator CheY